jgi:hypothetical protein
MSLMPEYDATAGFPPPHVEAFKRVAARNKMVISSRELNPLCTDLVLENYAAKGFHIKAKTCDWGPMAGFVLEDPRFTKASQNAEKQQADIEHAFEADARCSPVFISEARLTKLRERGIIAQTGTATPDRLTVSGAPTSGTAMPFLLVKAPPALPGAASQTMWGLYYAPGQTPRQAGNRKLLPLTLPSQKDLAPVMGMVNPANADGKLGIKSTVAGDYDLWCVFPHETAKDPGIHDRAMPLRATLPPTVGPLVRQRAEAAGLVFGQGQMAKLAAQKEDQHLGNVSLGIQKIRNELNLECQGAGYTAGNVVQHSDYGGNPFGTIDYPLIFFIPALPGTEVLVKVAQTMSDLQEVLRTITKLKYRVKLNPAWTVPSF